MKSFPAIAISIAGIVAINFGCSQSTGSLAQQVYPVTRAGVRCIVSNGIALYAAQGDSVFLSNSNGVNWQYAGVTPQQSAIFSLLATNSALFAGALNTGAFVSMNGGALWAMINTGLIDSTLDSTVQNGKATYYAVYDTPTVNALAARGDTIIAGTNYGAFITTNSGALWQSADSGLYTSGYPNAPNNHIDVISLAFINGNLYAGVYGTNLFVSSNDGMSWSPVKSGLEGQSVYAVADSGAQLYAAASSGVFLSLDYGADWTPINSGFTNSSVTTLVVIGGVLFAGTQANGVYQLYSDTSTFVPVNNGLTPSLISSLFVSGANLLAGTSGGIYYTSNNGAVWTPIALP
jgi:hypothetical protein